MSSQCSTFGPLLFLKYINNLTEELPNAKLFADDTLLFSVVCNINTSADEVSNDLLKINKWAYQWKMSFNSDPTKLQRKLITFYQDRHCSPYTKALSRLFSITVIFTTKLIMQLFIRNWNWYKIMLACINRSKKSYFKREFFLWRTRCGVFSVESLVQKAVLFL